MQLDPLLVLQLQEQQQQEQQQQEEEEEEECGLCLSPSFVFLTI